MYLRCPKCHHQPLPREQALPASCPACGVILAKVAAAGLRGGVSPAPLPTPADAAVWRARLLPVPGRVDRLRWRLRVGLLAGFAAWGLSLIAADHRNGAIYDSFIHGPLLVFHEAGHLIFSPLGQWMAIFGGTLMQWLMPAVMAGALLLKNRDPFGAALGLWLLGVSVLDAAPYMHDALHPQLTLLSGHTGASGGHDWIYLFSSAGLLPRAPLFGSLARGLGALIVLAALAWATAVLVQQRGRIAGDVLHEE